MKQLTCKRNKNNNSITTRNITISNPSLLFIRILRVTGIKYAQSVVSKMNSMLIFQKYCLALTILHCTLVHPSAFRRVHIFCADSDTVICLRCDCGTMKTITYIVNGFEIQVYVRGIKGIPQPPRPQQAT